MFDYTSNIISNFGNAIAGGTKFSSAHPAGSLAMPQAVFRPGLYP
jgi:hypothetical protein